MTMHFDRHYIDGAWRPAQGAASIDLEDPNTGTCFARVACGHAADADRAVDAARRAFAAWSAMALDDRIERVRQFGAALADRSADLVQAVAAEVGTPLKIARIVQVDAPIANVGRFIEVAQGFAWEYQVGHSRVLREPHGVVACITPWNFPLHQVVLKIVPALLAGNTVVLKPSELTPRTTQLICEAVDAAGFPPGVVNVVNGTGAVVGARLAAAEAVDMVSFTGSTEAGKAVMALAAATVKKATTELGGKSPALVLPGADLGKAIKSVVASCMLNNGQTCSALTRLLVPSGQAQQVEALLQQELARLVVGPSLAEGSRIGPLISRHQRDRVNAMIAQGIKGGATQINDAAPVPAEGFFVAPQAFRVAPDNLLAREEVFGPVLGVLTYDGVEQGMQMANDSVYGLAAAVWGEPEAAAAIARRIRAGQVDVNGARFNPLAPFGGYKQSGVGREGGGAGLEEFLQTKALQLP